MPFDPEEYLKRIIELYRQKDFENAARGVEALVNQANADSPELLEYAARRLAGEPQIQPLFNNISNAGPAVGFFQRLIASLEKHLPADHLQLARARDKLAMMYTLKEQYAASAILLEKSLQVYTKHYGPKHEITRIARSNLAIQHRGMNKTEKSDELFADTRVCDHLQPVLEDIVRQGVHIADVGTPWSNECNLWVYFEDVALDAEALKTRFKLPDVVAVHTHRGSHDGAEHGLVCNEHHDALMGAHPSDADGKRVIR
jgi:tetratricopeptide (TPR) repeat protein